MLYFSTDVALYSRASRRILRAPASHSGHRLTTCMVNLFVLPQEEHPMLAHQRTRPRVRQRFVGRRRPPPPKTTLAAVTMLVVGTVSVHDSAGMHEYAELLLKPCDALLWAFRTSGTGAVPFTEPIGVYNSLVIKVHIYRRHMAIYQQATGNKPIALALHMVCWSGERDIDPVISTFVVPPAKCCSGIPSSSSRYLVSRTDNSSSR